MNFKFARGRGGGGCDKQAQAQLFISSRPDSQTLTWSMVNAIKREIKSREKNDNDTGRDSNQQPEKWPAML